MSPALMLCISVSKFPPTVLDSQPVAGSMMSDKVKQQIPLAFDSPPRFSLNEMQMRHLPNKCATASSYLHNSFLALIVDFRTLLYY